jgi:AmiR/NasT family two-component response regulator
LQVGAAQLGVLDLYRRSTGPISHEALAVALTFADVAVDGLLDAQDTAPVGQAADGLDQVLDSQYVVYQAQGMTMVDLGGSLADALARLRAHAFAYDRPLVEVARDIVAGTLRLNPDPA